MAGKIHAMIEKIILQKARGNDIIAGSIRTKMILKGINVVRYNETSPDDPAVIKTLREIAKEFGVIV